MASIARPSQHRFAQTPLRQRANVMIWAFALYIFLFMFYVFPSGEAQPGDIYFTVILFPMLALLYRMREHFGYILPSAGTFLAFATLVNLANFTFTFDVRHLLSPVYYFYNLLVFLCAFSLCLIDREKFLNLVSWVCVAAVFVQLTAAMAGFGLSSRLIGTFNNPNQLGYWSIMVVVIYYLCRRGKALSVTDTAFLFAALLCVALSLSKAAMIGIFVAILIFLYSKLTVRNFLRMTVVAPISAIAIYFIIQVALGDSLSDIVESSTHRLERIGEQSDDSAVGRHYDRIWTFPQYLIFGAGEGGYERFALHGKAQEIHSIFGTLIFSYGVVGTALFMMMVRQMMRGARAGSLVIFVPIALYGLSHQALRSSLLWIAFGIVAAVVYERGLLAARTIRATR